MQKFLFQAVEIFYAAPGLSLLLLIPRGRSLRRLVELLTKTSIYEVTRRMHSLRVGTTLPLYTLRMTLLLPNKLQVVSIALSWYFKSTKFPSI